MVAGNRRGKKITHFVQGFIPSFSYLKKEIRLLSYVEGLLGLLLGSWACGTPLHLSLSLNFLSHICVTRSQATLQPHDSVNIDQKKKRIPFVSPSSFCQHDRLFFALALR